MATTRVPGRLWLLYLAAGLATAAGSMLLPDLAQSIVYDLIGLSAVVAILLGVRRHGLVRRGIWYGLAGGLVVFAAGDVVSSV